jgi:hypothetical protein
MEPVIQYRAENEDEARANATNYKLRIEETGTLTVAELTAFLTSTNVDSVYTDKLPTIQALNIILGHYGKSTPTIATVGSKSFSLSQDSPKWDLGAGLTALRGFFTSVRTATCRILVNINVSHGAFYEAIPLDHLMQKYGQANQMNRFKLETFLKRLRVQVIHLPEKKNRFGQPIPRIKTIFGLATKNDGHGLERPPQVLSFGAGPKDVRFFLNSAASSSASIGQQGSKAGGQKDKTKKVGEPGGKQGPSIPDGEYISVYDFFKRGEYYATDYFFFVLTWVKAYTRNIKNPNIPVVNVGNRENPVYLPAEVCIVMPGQNSQSKLDPAQTQRMIQFAVRKPWENANTIIGSANSNSFSPQANAALVSSMCHLVLVAKTANVF